MIHMTLCPDLGISQAHLSHALFNLMWAQSSPQSCTRSHLSAKILYTCSLITSEVISPRARPWLLSCFLHISVQAASFQRKYLWPHRPIDIPSSVIFLLYCSYKYLNLFPVCYFLSSTPKRMKVKLISYQTYVNILVYI